MVSGVGTGRARYDPAGTLKLYLYGYLKRIRSSRRLGGGGWPQSRAGPVAALGAAGLSDHRRLPSRRPDRVQGRVPRVRVAFRKLELFERKLLVDLTRQSRAIGSPVVRRRARAGQRAGGRDHAATIANVCLGRLRVPATNLAKSPAAPHCGAFARLHASACDVARQPPHPHRARPVRPAMPKPAASALRAPARNRSAAQALGTTYRPQPTPHSEPVPARLQHQDRRP